LKYTEHSFTASKTCRFFTNHEIRGDESELWIVLHGYGQLASVFINKFKSPNLDKALVVAPEGFHRFYVEGFSGKVGASWMTREDRLSDISDYVKYLDDLVDSISAKLTVQPHVNVLGFSQGGATAARWICQGKVEPNKLILWAASFPPDLNYPDDARTLNSTDLSVVIGDEDQFVSESDLEKLELYLSRHHIEYKLRRFKGGHTINREVLNELV
jgi:predicted esterase